jgi:hypothetical protein
VRHAHALGYTDINADLLAKLHAQPAEVTQ